MRRRTFSAALLSAPAVLLRAQDAPLKARIKIDTERTIGEVDPMIYGNFAEHLGRCIEGGIFEPGSGLSDAQGYRKDVLAAAKNMDVTLLRWPGGNFASNYHWRDGIGPRAQRPRRLEMAWFTVESNQFGTHEFLDYCTMLGCEPYVCANMGTGTIDEAQQWVEYVNGNEDTTIVRERKKNGRNDPWKVKYWGLGNEMDGPWQMGHKDATDYGKYALEAAKLMKWTDPSIKLIAAGSSHFVQGEWTEWNRIVLDHLKRHADYLALHTYVGNNDNDTPDFLASSLLIDERTKVAEGTINAALAGEPRSRKIAIAWDEYNVWYRARSGAKARGRNALEERYNLEDALVIGTFMNSFLNNAHIVKMANMAQLVNVIAPIFTNQQGLFLQTIYYPLQLFAKNARGTALSPLVEAPRYKTKRFDGVPYLDISTTINGDKLVINAVNRHLTGAIETDIILQDRAFTGIGQAFEVNGPDIKSENDFGVTKVKTESKTFAPSGQRARYSFPAHSVTQLIAPVQPA